MFISTAWAQSGDAGAGGALTAFLPLILIFVIFYFLLIRPQQKRQKQHQSKLQAIRRGDKVLTGGGVFGSVTKVVDDNELQVEIADGVKVRVARSMVADVISKTEPANGDAQPANDGQKKGGLLGGLLGGGAKDSGPAEDAVKGAAKKGAAKKGGAKKAAAKKADPDKAANEGPAKDGDNDR